MLRPLGGPPEGETDWDPLTIQSSCDFTMGLTSVNGQCVSAAVDSSALPTFDPTLVYGDAGSQSSGATSSCFDVASCFTGASPVTNIDFATCSFVLGTVTDAGVALTTLSNLALVTASDGTCLAQGQCYVPLENDPARGWSESAGVVTMVPGVCKVLSAGAALYAVGGGCAPKLDSDPVCQPYELVSPVGGADAGDGRHPGFDCPGGCEHPSGLDDDRARFDDDA
jgi:hypothetical protein